LKEACEYKDEGNKILENKEGDKHEAIKCFKNAIRELPEG